MSRYKCVENPDCFNCPYPDCKATMRDLNRQSAYVKRCQEEKRNQKIIDLYIKDKIKIADIAETMCVSVVTIRKILREGGFYDRVRHSKTVQNHS